MYQNSYSTDNEKQAMIIVIAFLLYSEVLHLGVGNIMLHIIVRATKTGQWPPSTIFVKWERLADTVETPKHRRTYTVTVKKYDIKNIFCPYGPNGDLIEENREVTIWHSKLKFGYQYCLHQQGCNSTYPGERIKQVILSGRLCRLLA